MWAENNEQQSSRVTITMCVFQTDAWWEGEWPQFGIQVPSQCEFTFQAKRASTFSGQKGLFLLVKCICCLSFMVLYSVYNELTSLMGILKYALSLLLPGFARLLGVLSLFLPGLQASATLCSIWPFSIVPLCNSSANFQLSGWSSWQRTSKYFADALHLWGHQIMHAFHDLENIRLLSTKWELAERLTWETHRQEEKRNPSSNWIENHVDYYLLSQAGWRSAENQIFLTHSLPVTVIFAWANFHSASKSCITFLLQWYMFSAVSVNKISPWVVESFSPYSSFSPQCPLHLSDQISSVP